MARRVCQYLRTDRHFGQSRHRTSGIIENGDLMTATTTRRVFSPAGAHLEWYALLTSSQPSWIGMKFSPTFSKLSPLNFCPGQPYHRLFLADLRTQTLRGRKVALASAAGKPTRDGAKAKSDPMLIRPRAFPVRPRRSSPRCRRPPPHDSALASQGYIDSSPAQPPFSLMSHAR